MNAYENTRQGIIKAGHNPDILEGLAKELSRANGLDHVGELYLKFEVEADKLPWPQDHDFGAIVLQAESKTAPNEIANFMLSEAVKRAHWCAKCATSGGEGLARSIHIKQLEHELDKYR